jgi:hypothetical protein
MRIPDGYTEKIQEIGEAAAKHGFWYENDQLEDRNPREPHTAHIFRVTVYLTRNAGDFMEDAIVPYYPE